VAHASAVDTLALAVAAVRASPRRNIAVGSCPILTRTNTIDAGAVITTHVRTHSFMVVGAAICARESLRTATHLVLGIAMTIVAAVVWTYLNLAHHTPISSITIAFPLVTDAMTIAVIWTLAQPAVGAGEARHAHTGAIVTESVDALGAEAGGAIRPQPSSLAFAHTVHTLATVATVSGAVFVGAFGPEEAGQTVARAVVAVSIARAVGRAGHQRAIVSLETRMALAQIVQACPMRIAIIWTCANSTGCSREALVTEACSIETRPVV